jgi:hypothetical protein
MTDAAKRNPRAQAEAYATGEGRGMAQREGLDEG